MRAIGYSLKEAFIGLRRAGRSAAMSVGTIAVAFLTLGGFLLASGNLQSIVDRWSEAAEMSVYLRDDVPEDRRAALVSELQAHRAVVAVEYISKAQAIDRFKSDFPELADVTAAAENPFPASIEVRLRTDPESTGAAEALSLQLSERAGIADVRYDRQWLARLLAIITGIRLVGVAVAAVLVIGAAFTVAAVVRLSLAARRDELEIMQLVGAPFAFIRGPSIAEGTLLGGFGAGLALLLLWGIYQAFKSAIGEALSGFVAHAGPRFLGPQEAMFLIGAALIVGGVTGTLASRIVR